MSDQPATGDAQIPDGSTTPDPEVVPPAEGTSSAATPDPASPDAEAQATGDKETGTPPASDSHEPERKPKPERVKELLAERNFWRDRALGSQPKPAIPEKPVESEAPPTLEQHGHDTEAWSKAYTEWARKDARSAVSEHLAKVREQEQQQQVTEKFVSRESAYAAENPDYYEAVADPTLQQFVTPTISEAIVVSDIGPKLSLHLATHRDELAAISRMRPTQQGIALGRLEARLAPMPAPQATPPRKPVQQTRAPAPPTPVGGQSPSKDLASMSTDEYLAARTWR